MNFVELTLETINGDEKISINFDRVTSFSPRDEGCVICIKVNNATEDDCYYDVIETYDEVKTLVDASFVKNYVAIKD